jgi:pimeloyl-ACP methyl ester carboxylesterase
MTSISKRLHINGVDLAVAVAGQGPPLIWGHGLMGSMAGDNLAGFFGWPQLAEHIQEVRYDARGHGTSGASGSASDYTWPRLADDMLAVADQLGIDRFVAGGQSMGCATSLYAALAAPQRIRGLLLVTPPTAWETRAEQSAMYEQMAGLVDRGGVAGLAALMAQQAPAMTPPLLLEAAPNLGAEMARLLSSYDARTLALVLRGAKLTDFPPREQIRTIAAPALILAWAGDRAHPLSTAAELEALLPHAQAHVAQTPADLWAWPQLVIDFVTHL